MLVALAVALGVCAAADCAASEPRVDSTAALSALPTSVGHAIRTGVRRSGDAPPLAYAASRAPCSSGGGLGDGVVEVAARDGGCWVAELPPAGVDLREFGADATGRVDSGGALAAAFALQKPATILIPPGVFRIACGHSFVAAAAVSLKGAGQTASVLRLDSGCPVAGDFFAWNGKSGVALQDFTLDLQTPAAPAALNRIVVAYAYAGDVHGFSIERVSILNGTAPSFLIGVGAKDGHTFSGVRIAHNELTLAVAAPTQNQCIALTTVNGGGFIPDAEIEQNVCRGSGIQVDGARTRVIGNDVSGYRFGTGLFTAYDTGRVTPANASSRDCLISGNLFHDTPAGLDVNGTAAGGLENNCVGARIIGNRAYRLGGTGFLNYASHAIYRDNIAYDDGKTGPGGAVGELVSAGFALNQNPSGNWVYQSQNVTLTGNKAYDSGRGVQRHGYVEERYNHFSSKLSGNDFRDAGAGEPPGG